MVQSVLHIQIRDLFLKTVMASSLVNNKYRITRRIGGGSFGEIYMGIGPNNEKVCLTSQVCVYVCFANMCISSIGCRQV